MPDGFGRDTILGGGFLRPTDPEPTMPRLRQGDDDYFPCPHCGAEMRVGSSFCRECGASDDSGWNEDRGDSAGGYGDDFDYDDFIRREFPEHAEKKPVSTRTLLIVAIVVALVIAILLWSLSP